MDTHTYDQILFTQATTPHMQDVWAYIGDYVVEELPQMHVGDRDVLIETHYLQEGI
jgi:hypothetical protein